MVAIVRVGGLACQQNHTFTFDEPMSVESCTQAICDLALRFGEDRKSEKAMVLGPTAMATHPCHLCLPRAIFSSPEPTLRCGAVGCRC